MTYQIRLRHRQSKRRARDAEVVPLGHGFVPPVIQNGRLLIRGTAAWETRETMRAMCGCCCISSGPIQE